MERNDARPGAAGPASRRGKFSPERCGQPQDTGTRGGPPRAPSRRSCPSSSCWGAAAGPARALERAVHRGGHAAGRSPQPLRLPPADQPESRRFIYDGRTELDFTPQDLAHLFDLYDEEIAYLDAELAKLFALLRERRLLDSTLIVIAADHGEEQYEHGGYGHCRSLVWETILRPPLLLRIPGVEPGPRRQALVDNLDIVPTVLDYLGLPTDGLPFDGASLRPVIEGDRPVHRMAFGNQGDTRAVTDGAWKLSFDLLSNSARLFDLAADPGEKTDLAA